MYLSNIHVIVRYANMVFVPEYLHFFKQGHETIASFLQNIQWRAIQTALLAVYDVK